MSLGGGSNAVVDRDKTTPLLLRVFWNLDTHNTESVYRDGSLPKNELHFYTWKDATLKELGELLKDVVAEARKKYARLDFSLVYPDREGRLKLRSVGCVKNGGKSMDDGKALRDISFQTGDYLDIAIQEDRGSMMQQPMGRGPPRAAGAVYGGGPRGDRNGGGDWGGRRGDDDRGGFRGGNRRHDLLR